VSFPSAPTQAFRPPDQPRWWHNDGDLGRPIRRSGWWRSAPRPGALRELTLRKPQGPCDVSTDLAVRGAASLVLESSGSVCMLTLWKPDIPHPLQPLIRV